MYSEPTKDPLPWKWVAETLAKILDSPAELLSADARVGASRGFCRPGQGEEQPDTSTASQKKPVVSESSSLDVLKTKLLQKHPGLLTSLKEHCGLQSEPSKTIDCKTNFQDRQALIPSVCSPSYSALSKMDLLKSNMRNKKVAHFAKLPLLPGDCVVTGCNHQISDTCAENENHQMLAATSQIQSQKSNLYVLSVGKDTEISGEETSCSLQISLKGNIADSIQRTISACADGTDIQAVDDSSMSKQVHNIRKRKVSTQDVQSPSVLGISLIPDNSTALLQGDASKATQPMVKQKVAAVESEELTLLNTDQHITDSNCQKTHQNINVISQAEIGGILNDPQEPNLEDTDQTIRQEVDNFSSRGAGFEELPQNSNSELYDTKKTAVGSNAQLPKQTCCTPAFDANNTILIEDSPRKEQSTHALNATYVNRKSHPNSYFVEAGDNHAQLGVDTSDLPVNECSRNMNPESLIVNRMAKGNLTSSDLQIVGSIFASEKQKLLSCQVDMNVKRDSCMKCNKGGGLLNCQCGVTIHENCLGTLIEIKNSGTFICPVCLHLSAVIALGKALNTVSQTSGAFRAFLSFGFLSQQEQLTSNGLINAREFDVSHQQMESHAAIEEINQSQINNPLHVSINQINENNANNDPLITKENETHEEVTSVNEGEYRELAPEMSEERQQDSLIDSRVAQKDDCNMKNDHMATRQLEVESVHNLDYKGNARKKGKHVDLDIHTTNQNLRTSLNTNQARMGHLAKHQGETSTYHGGAKKKKNVEKQLAEKNKETVRSDEICIGSSSRSNVQRRAKSQSHNKVVPAKHYSTLGRRNKLAWSDEEVQALEELVVSFTSGNYKNIPWRKILEAGGNRFHKTRQPVDLKDKWRNMKKAEKG